MAVTDIASRTYNHGWRLDPIVRSLLDTDFYKLLMLQMIREFYPDQRVTFSVINRSRHVRLAEIIDEGELRAQLDHARTIRFTKKELIWLAGNTFYGKTQMFSPDFINWLANFRLPEYELRKVDGQYELHFHGPWTHTTMWEIPALAIMNELRSRQATKGQGRFVLDVLYARAKAKLWSKVERLRKLEGLRLSDFGTRRRHGHLWQRWWTGHAQELAPGVRAEIERESARLLLVKKQMDTLEAAQRQAVADGAEPQVARLAQLRGIGESETEQGISKAGNRRARTLMVELAWSWLRYQPESELSKWFTQRFAGGGKRLRRIGMVAIARRLAIALWRYLEDGLIPDGAQLKAIGG